MVALTRPSSLRGGLARTGSLALAAGLLAACAGAPRPREAQAQVRFEIQPEGARVTSDEQFVGSARVLSTTPATFRPGLRRFTITAEGHFPHDLETELSPGLTTIAVRLRAIPR